MLSKISAGLIAGLMLIAGSAAAAPITGTFTSEHPQFEGALHAAATEGILDLSEAVAESAPFVLSFTKATGKRVSTQWTSTQGVVSQGSAMPYPDSTIEAVTLDAGRISDLTCGPRQCQFIIVADGAGTITATGMLSGDLPRSEDGIQFHGGVPNRTAADTYTAAVGAGAVAFPTGGATELASSVSGDVRIFFKFLAATWTAEDGRVQELDAMPEDRVAPDPERLVDSQRVVTNVTRFYVLDVEDARLEYASPPPGRWLAEDPLTSLTGIVRAASATGTLTFEGGVHSFENEDLKVAGDLIFRFTAPAATLPALATQEVRTHAGGDADLLSIGTRTLVATDSNPAIVAATGFAALLAAIVFVLHRAGLIPFYTRLSSHDILDHPKRKQLLEIIREAPGIHTLEMARTTGIARGVLQHHLRHLEAHRFIVGVPVGRSRNYYVPEDAPGGAVAQREQLLGDESRRRILEALRGGATSQRAVMEATGLSQRLVSYHLVKLEEGALIVSEPGMPKTYRAAVEGKSENRAVEPLGA